MSKNAMTGFNDINILKMFPTTLRERERKKKRWEFQGSFDFKATEKFSKSGSSALLPT
jgi:hypothetical protein